jgi:hypothetical protein
MDRMELLPRNLTPQPHFADGYSAKPQGEDPKQTATAEVLKIIALRRPLQPVLEVVARSATRFRETDDLTIFELDEQYLRAAAHWDGVPQDIGVRFTCIRGHVAGRASGNLFM